MSQRTTLPADVELEDRLAFGLTARQLAILITTAIGAYLAFGALSSALPAPVAAALSTPLGVAGVLLALGRRDGVSADRLALLGARHLSRPRRRVLAPENLNSGRWSRSGLAALDVPVRAVLRSGVVELAGGGFCMLLAASGTSFALRGDEEQAALVAAFGRFLNGLAEPVQIAVRGEPLDLEARASALRDAAARLPELALADAARGHARFLCELADGDQLRRREILLILGAQAPDRETAIAVLHRRAEQAGVLLAGAGVALRTLDGDEAAGLLASAMDPPGPPAGSHLDGEIIAC
ncbi:MAG: PrgI family protein [Solirubrobacteraceae bacterium]